MTYGINAPQGLARVGTKMSAADNEMLHYYKFDPETPYSMRDGDPLKIDGANLVSRWNNIKAGTFATITDLAVDAAQVVGVMRGVEYYSASTGQFKTEKNWIAGTPVKSGTTPRVLVDASPDTIYSIQTSISNAQTSYWSGSRIGSPSGSANEILTNPYLGVQSSDVGLYADIAIGGDTFYNESAGMYRYANNYLAPGVASGRVGDNPTDDTLLGTSPSGYYLDYSTVLHATNNQAVPNQTGCVRIEGIDTRLNNKFCVDSSETEVDGGEFLTIVPNGSFNNVLVSLANTTSASPENVLPVFTASGKMGTFGLSQLQGRPMGVASPGKVLPLPLIGPIDNGSLMIHSYSLEYEGGSTAGTDAAGGIFAYITANPNLGALTPVVSTRAQWVQLSGSTGAAPRPLLTESDFDLIDGDTVYNLTIPTTPYRVGPDDNDNGVAGALLATYNTFGLGWALGTAASYPQVAANGVLKWKIRYSILPT